MRKAPLLSIIASLFMLMVLAMPSQASLIEFDLDFGIHGTGLFAYDDDNGGTDNGFTKLILDFSSVDPLLSDIQLNIDGLAFIGHGSVRTERPAVPADLFDILYNDPTHNGAFILLEDMFTMPFFIAFSGLASTGSAGYSGFCPSGGTHELIRVPTHGGYAFCTSEAFSSGQFTASETVPEPFTLLLMATGLAGIVFTSRKKKA